MYDAVFTRLELLQKYNFNIESVKSDLKIELINDEMIYEMDHIWNAVMKSSEAMRILAVMNATFAIA